MFPHTSLSEWFLGLILILSALGVILFRKPIYASLSFLLTLLSLASFYLILSAEFIAVMQILVYAGAILVIFVFVIVLFQDAHAQIEKSPEESNRGLLAIGGASFVTALCFFGWQMLGTSRRINPLPDGFGSVQAIGKALYLDFFFPFEAVILLFLAAVVGALYIAKKER